MPANPQSKHHQLELILPELCFPGRDAVTSTEIAGKLGCTIEHIHNCVDDPAVSLIAVNIGRKERGAYRIPVTSYYAWLISCLTSVPAENPILNLDTPKLVTLFVQLAERLELRGHHPHKLLKTK